ncbi:MAG: bifunctional phosphopantothenoylcysteine decarboxylase/phosphopantothenate--cysteine ligase CoaBC [Hyphomicrobiales bacterium]
MLKGKNILIGVSGSIAAYKIPLLVRLFKKEGANVQIVMSESARDFVTPLTLSALSGNPALTEPFDERDGSWNSHVDMGIWADVLIMAPSSANTLAKMAHGISDNLLVTTYLSAKCPVFFAPAMDLDMYKHPTTAKNVEILKSYGNIVIEPTQGELASGLCGAGRMEEPDEIFRMVQEHFASNKPLQGKKAVVSAGPTYELIDPVRFIGNFSSGYMGLCIAEELAEEGAEVTLVMGPSQYKSEHPLVNQVNIVSSQDMYEACTNAFHSSDIGVMSAAVADYKPSETAENKIKKKTDLMSLDLIKTQDTLAELGSIKSDKQFLVGFALETENEVENAKGKLQRKNLDFIVLNSLQDKGAGFRHKTNKITIIDKNQQITSFDLKSKEEVAKDIVAKIVSDINN